MIFAVVLSGVVRREFALTGDPTSTSASEREAYKEAASAVGRDPVGHARLALWCERTG